jgi:hypothetical protein
LGEAKAKFIIVSLISHVQRLTTQESLQYVKDKLGSEIGADHFNHVRAELKRDVKKNLTYLQTNRFAYVREFFERIEEDIEQQEEKTTNGIFLGFTVPQK